MPEHDPVWDGPCEVVDNFAEGGDEMHVVSLSDVFPHVMTLECPCAPVARLVDNQVVGPGGIEDVFWSVTHRLLIEVK